MIIRVDTNGKITDRRDNVESVESLTVRQKEIFKDYQNYTGEVPDAPVNTPFMLVDEVMVIDDTLQTQRSENEARSLWKLERTKLVSEIKVTTAAGNEFDGDETSQTRMSRAISVMDSTETTTWVLANNTPLSVTRAELKEALKLAGEAQTLIWIQ